MTVIINVTTNADKVIRDLEASQFRILQAERNAMREIKDGVLQEFKRTTASWHHQPRWQVYEARGMGGVTTIKVSTDDKPYMFVDKGTRPHMIFPKRAKALRFTWGGHGSYIAKTVPGYITSRNGGPTGKQVFRKGVRHPGTEPRRFTELVQALWQRKAGEVVNRHVRMALDRGTGFTR
jgi:hypothetical protein